MALDETPGEIVTRTRDQIRDQYLRDYALRIPTADVGPDTLPYVDASGLADAEMVLVNDAVGQLGLEGVGILLRQRRLVAAPALGEVRLEQVTDANLEPAQQRVVEAEYI